MHTSLLQLIVMALNAQMTKITYGPCLQFLIMCPMFSIRSSGRSTILQGVVPHFLPVQPGIRGLGQYRMGPRSFGRHDPLAPPSLRHGTR